MEEDRRHSFQFVRIAFAGRSSDPLVFYFSMSESFYVLWFGLRCLNLFFYVFYFSLSSRLETPHKRSACFSVYKSMLKN